MINSQYNWKFYQIIHFCRLRKWILSYKLEKWIYIFFFDIVAYLDSFNVIYQFFHTVAHSKVLKMVLVFVNDSVFN